MSKNFNHSIKVPRLYKAAAKIVEKVQEENHSLKELVYSYKHFNTKALYALVVKAIKNGDLLNCIIRCSGFLVKEKRIDPWLARVLITELIWGSKRLPSGSKPCDTVMNYSEEFSKQLENAKKIHNLKESNTPSVFRPRFVRVNTIRISVNEVIDSWIDDGWNQILYDNTSYEAYLEALSSLDKFDFINDFHIKELFAFAPKTEFHSTQFYQNGSIILQDKASCLPAYLLNPPPGSIIMDLCAAPGMKTSHMAAIINNQGKIYAIEKNERRFNILKKQLEHFGADCVQVMNKDALLVSGQDYPDVEYLLVDPSCTGSGRDDLEGHKEEQERVDALVAFQILILRHALTRFPNVKKIIYSTCSLNNRENEHVLSQSLNIINAQGPVFEIEKNILSSWNHFGDKEILSGCEHCLYANPDSDLTGGFFVALLKRVAETPTDILQAALSKHAYKLKKNKNTKWKIEKDIEENSESKIKKGRKNKYETKTEDLTMKDSSKKKKTKSNLEAHLSRLLASSDEESDQNDDKNEDDDKNPYKTKKIHKKSKILDYKSDDVKLEKFEINEEDVEKNKKKKKKSNEIKEENVEKKKKRKKKSNESDTNESSPPKKKRKQNHASLVTISDESESLKPKKKEK